MIYPVLNIKRGGIGKTTAAVHLATMLSHVRTTLLISILIDLQGKLPPAWRRDNPAYDTTKS